MTLALKL